MRKGAVAFGGTRNRRGQNMGAKGDKTRQDLMDATRSLLLIRKPWEIRVADIAAACNLNGPNFYAYFSSIDDVILQLCDQAAADLPDLVSFLERNWFVEDMLPHARIVAAQGMAYWEKHGQVLQIANLLADNGVPEFMRARTARLAPTYAAIVRRIEAGQKEGRVRAGLSAHLHAQMLASHLEHWGYTPALAKDPRISHDEILESLASFLVAWVVGTTTRSNRRRERLRDAALDKEQKVKGGDESRKGGTEGKRVIRRRRA